LIPIGPFFGDWGDQKGEEEAWKLRKRRRGVICIARGRGKGKKGGGDAPPGGKRFGGHSQRDAEGGRKKGKI